MQEKTAVRRPATIDEYIAGFPEDIQRILGEIRGVIKEAAPAAQEMIKYDMPNYYLNGNLIYFAVNKRHIGVYPLTPGMEAAIDGLSAYKGAKSLLHFSLDKPIPHELLRQVVEVRVAENLAK